MAFQPMPLSRKLRHSTIPNWIFELKYDGFGSLAVIQDRAELISRNGDSFKSFEPLRKELKLPYQGKTVGMGIGLAQCRPGVKGVLLARTPSAGSSNGPSRVED
jgi:hypothetical protein